MADRLSLGRRLQREREHHHWTQEQLAEKIGGSVPSINRWEHDRATPRQEMIRLLEEVFGRQLEDWGRSKPIPWNVPFLRNPYFTGRERILQRLHQALAAEQVVALSQTRAISGLGGVGKTQTAIEYAYRYADEYEAVLWIRADSHEALVSDFAALAAVFELREQEEADQFRTIAAAKRWLQEHGPWLLIFDNADDLTLISDFLPRRAGGATLLTTRSQITGPHIKKVELDRMGREEGVTFLLRRMTSAEDESEEKVGMQRIADAERQVAEELWELMDGLPLALDQAGAYVEAKQCSLTDYLRLYRTHRGMLLQERGSLIPEHPDAVSTTWSLSFQRVEEKNPAAADLLRLCAFLAPDAIAEEILTEGASSLGEVLAPVTSNALHLNQAIEVLRTYSLVRRDPAEHTLSMHRLVQAVLQDTMTEQESRQWMERAITTLDALFPDVTHDAALTVWSQCERLLPHILVSMTVTVLQKQNLVFASLLYKTAKYLHERARYEQAESLFQNALQIREQAFGPEHLDVASSLNGLVTLYYRQGRYAEAVPLVLRALHIREATLGPGHPDVASLLNNLAILYREQGKYTEAEPLYQRALHLLEEIWGPEHPNVAYPLNNLAGFYAGQGKYTEAEPLFKRSLRIREQMLGSQHPQVAATLNNLAELYRDQSKYTEAEPLYQRSLLIFEQALGVEHPDVAYSLNGLADLYRDQSKYTEAESLYQRALHIREQAWGTQHPDTAETIHGLAQLREAQGNREEARAWYVRALAVREQALGEYHPRTMETRTRLIALLHALGRHEEAAQLEAAQAES